MEDEEGYMALSIQPRKKHKQNPQHQEPETQLRHRRCCQIISGAGGAVILLLAGAAVALRICAFQRKYYTDPLEEPVVPQGRINDTENNSRLKNIISRLQEFMCKIPQNKLTESFRCKLCPENWLRLENKCYWVSKIQATWQMGQEDCRAKGSQMLVIQKQEEAAFIQSISEEAQLLWIGLMTTFPLGKWIWEDGSPLDENQSEALGPVEANSCGMLNDGKMIAESCSTVTSWVCEKEAFDLSSN
uniref:Killer cell lectin-like receptor subfamily B member 1B allele A isoform X1 n=1 Tax=Pogona vitticeps TaxID=103695 RepID=A0ABM5FIK4_9SAUR